MLLSVQMSVRQQDNSALATHREVDERYGQQHRDEDGEPNRHHHDVPRYVHIVTEQKLRVHMSCGLTTDGSIAQAAFGGVARCQNCVVCCGLP